MSGIAASFGTINDEEAASMLHRLAHRAENHDASLSTGGNWVGSRYSDAVGISQPIMSADGSVAMVADGEIYGANNGDSRARLKDIPDRYQTDGVEIFAKLDGVFAMVLIDDTGRMTVARDRIGIKPLYWARKDDEIRFASEVGAFDPEWFPLVEFFPPGHVWESETGLVRFAPDIQEESPTLNVDRNGADYPQELLDRIREQLVESVHREMMDDTSVVAFLSGGLDSSLIAAIAQHWMVERGERLKTYAIGLKGSPDLLAAREVAEYLNTNHTELIYTTEEALAAVPEVVRTLESFDPTLVRSSVANFILSKYVAGEADVTLSGEGADELFAGYEYLRDLDTAEDLDEELRVLIAELHQTGLQRVDRTTMAHGLQARMPFLSNAMIELGMSIPASLKQADDTHPEKQLLRLAFRGWLPDEILWRKKAQFGEGSGAGDALTEAVCSGLTEEDLEEGKGAVDPPLRTREELAYYEEFRDALPGVKAESIVSRFAET